MTAPVTGIGCTHTTSGVEAATHAQQQVERFIGLPHYSTRGPETDALQRSLNLMGAKLSLDGVYGPKTEAAVRDFLARDMPELQRGAGIPSGGGSYEDRFAIRRLQHALTILTGRHLEPDGKFGDNTRAALIAWQQSLGINNPSPEGVVNRATWNALISSVVDRLEGSPNPRVQSSVTHSPTAIGANGALQTPATHGVRTTDSSHVTTPTRTDASIPPDGRTESVPPDGRVDRTPSANWPPRLSRYSNSGVTTELPVNDNLSRYKHYYYGTARTIAMVTAVAAEYRRRTGMVLRVGDISKRGGGSIPGHGSHKYGKNVDLDLAFNDGRTTAEPSRESTNASWRSGAYDRDATRTIIKLIKQCNPNAQILFNDPALVREGLVTPFANHDNHMHVQHLG